MILALILAAAQPFPKLVCEDVTIWKTVCHVEGKSPYWEPDPRNWHCDTVNNRRNRDGYCIPDPYYPRKKAPKSPPGPPLHGQHSTR